MHAIPHQSRATRVWANPVLSPLRKYHHSARTRFLGFPRMAAEEGRQKSNSDDFSVFVLASDLGVDARSLLGNSNQDEEWHDCPTSLISDEDFSDLDLLQAFRFEGYDKSGNRIFRIVGKYFPVGTKRVTNPLSSTTSLINTIGEVRLLRIVSKAPVVSGERLKRYIFHKIVTELPEGPFCIVYMHSTVQKEDNSPGISILRWIYEELPSDYKERLQIVYFLHPGIRSRLVFATLGRFFLSEGVYWKIKYVSRLQYLWEDIKKGQVEIPEFVQEHDAVLEHRPLTDYGIEPDNLHLNDMPAMGYSFGRYEERWAS